MLMRDSRYEQFEISREMIEQELHPVVCEQRQTDIFKENYNIDDAVDHCFSTTHLV